MVKNLTGKWLEKSGRKLLYILECVDRSWCSGLIEEYTCAHQRDVVIPGECRRSEQNGWSDQVHAGCRSMQGVGACWIAHVCTKELRSDQVILEHSGVHVCTLK